MRWFGWSVMVCGLLCLPTSVAAQCEGDGEGEYVCGPVRPEALYAIADSPWGIVSSKNCLAGLTLRVFWGK